MVVAVVVRAVVVMGSAEITPSLAVESHRRHLNTGNQPNETNPGQAGLQPAPSDSSRQEQILANPWITYHPWHFRADMQPDY